MGWYWNLFWAALRNTDHPGFLASRKNLWTFAGAHRRAHWDANCALVMAAFELREISGQKLWCLPPLVRIVDEQLKKLQDKKGRGISEVCTAFHRDVGDLSPPLQSGFAFDLSEAIQIQKQSPTRVRAPARETGYSNEIGDAIDVRKMAKAWEQLCKRNAEGKSGAADMSNRRMFEYVCEVAGVSIERGLELEARRKKWPEKVPDWLREETG